MGDGDFAAERGVEVGQSAGVVYRYVADLTVAEAISRGVYRFYELTKYIRMEDGYGRADGAECSVTFLEKEYASNPEKLPVGSYNGVEFHCVSIQPDEAYISQYFVLCMSTEASERVLGDARYRVDIHRDQFELLSMLLDRTDERHDESDGRKFFSHGAVEYYDIDNHPAPIANQMWKEVYVKHRRFMHQREYRAAFFINAAAFERVCKDEEVIRRAIYHMDGTKMDFDLEFRLQAGLDTDGWRYLEIDTSEFAQRIGVGPGNISELK